MTLRRMECAGHAEQYGVGLRQRAGAAHPLPNSAKVDGPQGSPFYPKLYVVICFLPKFISVPLVHFGSNHSIITLTISASRCKILLSICQLLTNCPRIVVTRTLRVDA